VANLTISIDDELLKRARVRAAEQDTSVNAILRDELKRFAGHGNGLTPGAALAKLARENPGNSRGQNWTREDLYKERLDRI
jgi:plasmid stability protein